MWLGGSWCGRRRVREGGLGDRSKQVSGCEDQCSRAASVSPRKSPSPPCPVPLSQPRGLPGNPHPPRPSSQLPAPRSHPALQGGAAGGGSEEEPGCLLWQRLEQNGFSNFKPQFVFK